MPELQPGLALVAGGDALPRRVDHVWDVVDPIQRLIRDRVPVDEWRLSDPDMPLEQLAPLESA